MTSEPMYEPPQAELKESNSDDTKALIGLILGALGLICWCLPLAGVPVTIAGLVLGIMGLQSNNRGFAIAAIVLSSIGLVLSLVNAAAGVYLNLMA